MRRLFPILLLAIAFASPAWAQNTTPCPAGVHLSVGYRVQAPVCPGKPLNLVAQACGPCTDLTMWTFMPPGPIQVHATMDTRNCLLAVCQPDSLVIPIGTYAAGHYRLLVEVRGVVLYPDSMLSCLVVQQDSVVFDVPSECGPPPAGCFLYRWRGPNTSTVNNACTAQVGPGTPARVVLDVSTTVPIAGLQGRLVLDPAALAITNLRAIGAAAGWQLTWQPLPDGASFVMVSGAGRPIRPPAACVTCAMNPAPVLEVTASSRDSVPVPAVTRLFPASLIASDSTGGAVPLCPTFAPIAPATICAGSSCDFNGDGHVDIRDLVLMMRCIRGASTCPDSASLRFDCNGDGRLGLEDVLCCARRIIRGRIPTGVPTRPAVGLQVVTGAPVATATGVDLPVRVLNADLMGGARLSFTYAFDRFSDATVEIPGDDGSWIVTSEAGDGELLFGAVANAPPVQGASDLDLVIHFTLAEGEQPSAIQLGEADFAATDGVALAATAGPVSVPQTGLSLVQLSAARPNPFTHETRFVVTVASAAPVELAIYDLNGRRVATLHRGALAAGPHTFGWSGMSASGRRAADGVYLLRAQVAGESETRKLVLLRAQ